MKRKTYHMTEKMFLYPGKTAAWHFLPVTKQIGQNIREIHAPTHRGFGSLPVEVTVGKTTWRTSIFPDKSSGSYLLPVKAVVRKAEDIQVGERVSFSLRIV